MNTDVPDHELTHQKGKIAMHLSVPRRPRPCCAAFARGYWARYTPQTISLSAAWQRLSMSMKGAAR